MKKIITFMLMLALIDASQAYAFWGFATKSVVKYSSLSSSKMVQTDNQIIKLSKLSGKEQGTKKVGKELAKLGLPDDVLEDTYMRIAIHQGKISRNEAEEMYAHLSGVPGFRTTLRKITGNNPAGTDGHLNELRISYNAKMKGFEVKGIGEKFSDGMKQANTDIDIVLSKGERIFAIEAKNYKSTTVMPMDKYRADLNTLVQYKKSHSKSVVSIFSLTNKPNDAKYLERLINEAKKRDIEFIHGSPSEQIIKIKFFDKKQ